MHHAGTKGFLKPCLLLLLRERSDHGYDLVVRLAPLGLGEGEAASVYRALRELEREQLVRSRWQPSTAGPLRRTYELTTAGVAALASWVRALEQTRAELDYFLYRYEVLVAPRDWSRPGGAPGSTNDSASPPRESWDPRTFPCSPECRRAGPNSFLRRQRYRLHDNIVTVDTNLG
jgi:poly-beta-hydroxybutyrate-responsive repressor